MWVWWLSSPRPSAVFPMRYWAVVSAKSRHGSTCKSTSAIRAAIHTVICGDLLELDRGTERGDRLRRKLLSYARLGRRRDAPDVILFYFPSEERERRARRKLDIDIRIPIATSHRGLYETDPLGQVWLPPRLEQRIHLVELQARRDGPA